MSLTIRPMVESDAEWASELERKLFPDAWTITMITEEITHPTRRYFAAELNETPIGYAGVWLQTGDAEIMTIGVDHNTQRQGVGAALLARLLDEAQVAGVGQVFLEVRADNVAAQELYRKYGFEKCGIRRRYYASDGCDAIVMRRTTGARAPISNGLGSESNDDQSHDIPRDEIHRSDVTKGGGL